jgi:nitroimidazol reductase NimA-like FMN-containing flavoprotein (pyridoxamine 5'-phosphate oxidase superfamily)
MVYTPIYCFSAPKGKYLEPATSSHPIEVVGHEIHPDFISMVRELNFHEPNP